MTPESQSLDGHMEWEFSSNHGPLDPQSPFTRLSQQIGAPAFASSFATSSNPNSKSNPPPPQRTQSKSRLQQPAPPSSSTFSPRIGIGAGGRSNTAPPFRNPAFTTPRRPVDEPQLSEMSGAEDSPGARTDDASDYPETPELHPKWGLADLDMTTTASSAAVATVVADAGAVSPVRVDKTLRYRKYGQHGQAPTPLSSSSSSFRRHQLSGRGEISRRHGRDSRSRGDVAAIGKRKRHAHDRDVASAVRGDYGVDDEDNNSDDDDEHEDGNYNNNAKKNHDEYGRRRGRDGGGLRDPIARGVSGGSMFASIFSAMEEHPNAPENLARWGAMVMNMAIMCGILYGAYYILDALRGDVFLASTEEQAALGSKITACMEQYRSNKCGDGPLPALRELCAEWFDCMNQSPHAVKRFQLMIRQAAEAINVFSGTMHLRGWAMFFCALILWLFFTSRASGTHAVSSSSGSSSSSFARGSVVETPRPSHFLHAATEAASPPPFKLFPQTPRRRVMPLDYGDEFTDTDVGSPEFRFTASPRPSAERSPTKGGDRGRTPGRRSPSKRW